MGSVHERAKGDHEAAGLLHLLQELLHFPSVEPVLSSKDRPREHEGRNSAARFSDKTAIQVEAAHSIVLGLEREGPASLC